MSSNIIDISVISPVYGAEKIVDKLVESIADGLSGVTPNFEIILVEDGSPDNSWNKIEENCKKHSFVKGVKLSRNFGQHYAITAGLAESSGKYVIVMDCDLQDNPKYIKELYDKAQMGYEIVYTVKKERSHSFFKNLTASIFFHIFNYLSENQVASRAVGSYSLLSRKVVNAFLSIKDTHRHYLMVLRMLGFSYSEIEIIHEKRYEGKSSYNLSKLIKHAIDGITSQSDKLLRISITIGFVFCAVSLFLALYTLIKYFMYGALPGYTSTTILLLLSTGLILLSIGIAGIYIGKIFEQSKNRPLYFIDKKINF
ncbi:MAG: glycosyltransferase family 2 protein [Bacteroidia bacterium]